MNQTKKIKNKNSLLWVITGKNLLKPSYLLGTMHILCEKDFEIKDKITRKFNECDTLIMELNLSDADEMNELQSFSQSDEPLSGQLNEQEKNELNHILQSDYQVSLEQVDHLSPVLIINMMVTKAIECEEQKVIELELIKMAKENNMNMGGLETAAEQMEIANKIYEPREIIRQLKQGDSYKEIFSEMVQAYKEEDLKKLSKLVSDRRFMSTEAEERMVYDRNKKWVKNMPELMQEKSIFFAVGAGHLPGRVGVIQLLKRAGYTVAPVFE